MRRYSPAWKVSRYARYIPDRDGDGGYLYSSFMGALARVDAPAARRHAALFAGLRRKNRSEAPGLDLAEDDPLLQTMVTQGFAVSATLDEQTAVERLLQRERDHATHLIILPHEDCNFRCTYCYETFERGKMKPDVVAAMKRMATARIATAGMLNVGWFGGEPCLAMDVIDTLSAHFMAECAKAGVPYRAAITTNGYFLTPRNLDILFARGVAHFQVTIDGSEQAHDGVRKKRGGQGTYRRIFDNLVDLTRRHEEFTVAIRVNFTPSTIASINEFLDEARPHFATDDRFFLDFHPVGRWGGPNDATMDVVDEPSSAAARLSLSEAAACRGFPATSLLDALKPHGAACYAGKANSLVIGADGRLYKCTVAFQDDRNRIGWLRPDGTLDIDEAKFKLWTEPVSTSGKCGTCSYFGACQSRACPLAAIEAAEPPCPFTEDEFEQAVNATVRQVLLPRLAPHPAAVAQPSGVAAGRHFDSTEA